MDLPRPRACNDCSRLRAVRGWLHAVQQRAQQALRAGRTWCETVASRVARVPRRRHGPGVGPDPGYDFGRLGLVGRLPLRRSPGRSPLRSPGRSSGASVATPAIPWMPRRREAASAFAAIGQTAETVDVAGLELATDGLRRRTSPQRSVGEDGL